MSGSKKTFFSLFFFGEKRTKNALTAKTRSVSFLDCTRTLAITMEFVLTLRGGKSAFTVL